MASKRVQKLSRRVLHVPQVLPDRYPVTVAKSQETLLGTGTLNMRTLRKMEHWII